MKNVNQYKKDASRWRTDRKAALMSYWKNQFFTRYDIKGKIEEGFTFEAKKFILNELWNKGFVAAYLAVFREEDIGEGEVAPKFLIFTRYSVSQYKRYNVPLYACPIWGNYADPGTPRTPNGGIKPLLVDKEIVLGFARYDKTPVIRFVEQEVDEILDLEAAKRNNVFAHKKPLAVKCTAESKNAALEVMEGYADDSPFLLVPSVDAPDVSQFDAKPQYIIDKLDNAIAVIENRIKTYLGFNNNDIQKSEHLIVDEVNANNSEIMACGDVISTNLEEWLDKISRILGVKGELEVKVDSFNIQPMTDQDEEKPEEEEEK